MGKTNEKLLFFFLGGGGINEQFALDVILNLSGGKLKIPAKKSLKIELLWQKDDNTL